MNEKVLAVLCNKITAVDFTPIYYFRATETIRKGTVVRFDAAETALVKEMNVKE